MSQFFQGKGEISTDDVRRIMAILDKENPTRSATTVLAVLAIMAGCEDEADQAAFWDHVRHWGPKLVEPMKRALALIESVDKANEREHS